MKRTWTIIGVRDVARSCKWYQSLFGQPEAPPAAISLSFTRRGEPFRCALKHRGGPIDAHDRHACSRKRKRNAPGAASEFQYRTTRLQGDVPPERHVATSECPGVFPVVEGSVRVPPCPALALCHRSRS